MDEKQVEAALKRVEWLLDNATSIGTLIPSEMVRDDVRVLVVALREMLAKQEPQP